MSNLLVQPWRTGITCNDAFFFTVVSKTTVTVESDVSLTLAVKPSEASDISLVSPSHSQCEYIESMNLILDRLIPITYVMFMSQDGSSRVIDGLRHCSISMRKQVLWQGLLSAEGISRYWIQTEQINFKRTIGGFKAVISVFTFASNTLFGVLCSRIAFLAALKLPSQGRHV